MEDAILSKLTDGDHTIRYRLARGDNPQGTGPAWRLPRWGYCQVARRQKTFRRGKTVYPAGQLILLYLNTSWAEYDESAYRGDGLFEAEGYWLKILEVK